MNASEYSTPISDLIFFRFASFRYNKAKLEIEAELKAQKDIRNQQKVEDIAILKCGFYLPPEAEYDYLLNLPGKEELAKKIKKTMKDEEMRATKECLSEEESILFDMLKKEKLIKDKE